jgi:transcriptional regulator with XRE-family HTH domain
LTTDTPGRKPQRRTRGKPSYVDREVGRRVKELRVLLGWTQTQLADRLDITFQQIQKYERGANRIGAGRLYEIAQAMEVSVAHFFEGLSTHPERQSTDADRAPNPLEMRETQTLAAAFYRIKNPAARRRLYELARAMADSSHGESDDGGAESQNPAV